MRGDKASWVLSFLGICAFIVILLGLILGLRNRADVFQPAQDRFLELSAGERLSQRFTAKHDFINIVILNFKNPGLANHDQFRFLLLSEKGEILVERLFSGYNIGDPSQVRFQFDPIPNSKNKNFTISLEALPPTSIPKIGVGAKSENILSFSVYYRANDKKTVLVDFLSNMWGKIFKDPLFFISWLFTILVLAGIGIKQIGKSL